MIFSFKMLAKQWADELELPGFKFNFFSSHQTGHKIGQLITTLQKFVHCVYSGYSLDGAPWHHALAWGLLICSTCLKSFWYLYIVQFTFSKNNIYLTLISHWNQGGRITMIRTCNRNSIGWSIMHVWRAWCLGLIVLSNWNNLQFFINICFIPAIYINIPRTMHTTLWLLYTKPLNPLSGRKDILIPLILWLS